MTRGGAMVRETESGARACAVLAVLMLSVPATVGAQEDIAAIPGLRWIGRRVVQKARDLTLRDDKQVVSWDGRTIHIYRVERAEGAQLRLKADLGAGGPSGWAAAVGVVRLDEAEDFFT